MQDLTSGYFYFNNCEINEVYSKYNSVKKNHFYISLYVYRGPMYICVFLLNILLKNECNKINMCISHKSQKTAFYKKKILHKNNQYNNNNYLIVLSVLF